MASKPARARLLWAILSLVLPVTFGHTTACRSPALIFSAAIHFAMKCSAPCAAVLRHSASSWAAVVHWSALMPKAVRSSRKHPIHSFSWPPHSPRPPTIFRTSRALAVSYTSCAPQIPRTRYASCVKSARCSMSGQPTLCWMWRLLFTVHTYALQKKKVELEEEVRQRYITKPTNRNTTTKNSNWAGHNLYNDHLLSYETALKPDSLQRMIASQLWNEPMAVFIW